MEEIKTFWAWLSSLSLTAIAGTTILGLVTIRSIFDVAKGLGFLPDKLYHWLYRSEDARFKNLLNDLGIIPRKDYYQSLTNSLDNPIILNKLSPEEIKDQLLTISKKFIDEKSLTVGDSDNISVKYFLHLRRAFITGYDVRLADIMSSFIIYSMEGIGRPYDAIVSRKGALDILGFFVSKTLNIPFVLFHDHENIMSQNGAMYFDNLPANMKNPIIVDDSCVSGDSIIKMANYLKKELGIKNIDAFVLFTRKKDAIAKLKLKDINLHVIEHFEDEDLKKLKDINNGEK